MARMLTNVYRDNAHQECRHGCCTIRERHRLGGRRDQRLRRWARATDKRAWRRGVDLY